ncbi:MAG TPA: 16S rRNA processing protein RimM [Syntrophomonas sp.]|jgi:16S rRNA processing protein RimM|nr:16S rRNA processing protein RimM [Syntrophomonas sp.]
MDDNRVSIGKVVGVYGIHGWVRVFPLTDFPERFKTLQRVGLRGPGMEQILEVEASRPYQHGYLLKFKGIDSPEAARVLHQALLQIDEKEIYPLPEGVYYHFQLQGLAVYDERLGHLGEISEILETGANDVYVVDSPRFGEILIPAIKEIILNVDVEAGHMQVALLPGLIDEGQTR